MNINQMCVKSSSLSPYGNMSHKVGFELTECPHMEWPHKVVNAGMCAREGVCDMIVDLEKLVFVAGMPWRREEEAMTRLCAVVLYCNVFAAR